MVIIKKSLKKEEVKFLTQLSHKSSYKTICSLILIIKKYKHENDYYINFKLHSCFRKKNLNLIKYYRRFWLEKKNNNQRTVEKC